MALYCGIPNTDAADVDIAAADNYNDKNANDDVKVAAAIYMYCPYYCWWWWYLFPATSAATATSLDDDDNDDDYTGAISNTTGQHMRTVQTRPTGYYQTYWV